jgi:acylphosphatase
MERFVILVSGRVQKVGYRSKVIALARDMGIAGWVGNLPDGRVKVVAEGDAAALERFASALKVKNSLIDVAAVEVERSIATGEFDDFSKLVDRGETDSRLDRSAELLKELIDVTRDGFFRIETRMDRGFSDLGQKMDQMLDKQDQMLDKQDQMLDKQDQMLDKQDQMLDKQDETTGEVRGLRADMKGSFDIRLERIETALKDKGII